MEPCLPLSTSEAFGSLAGRPGGYRWKLNLNWKTSAISRFYGSPIVEEVGLGNLSTVRGASSISTVASEAKKTNS